MISKISVLKCPDYRPDNVERVVRESIDKLGGIAAFIKPGSRVLLKPNLLMPIEPEKAITTHPEIVRAIIRVLKDIQAQIFIGDTPSVWGKKEDVAIEEVHRRTGMLEVADKEGARLIDLRQINFQKGLPLAGFLNEVDAVINIPKFKTHGFMVLTGATKNLFGLIPGLSKSQMHKEYFKPEEFAGMLVRVYEAVKPVLNIVDAIDVIEGDGPGTSGNKRHLGLIVAGTDAIAVDSVLAGIVRLAPLDIPTIAAARKRNLGNSDLNSIEVLGEEIGGVVVSDFKLPQPSLMNRIPKPLFNLLKGLIDCRPKINPGICVRCKKCQFICPEQVITIEPEIRINYKKCIRCFCCQEVCPQAAISIKKSLLAKILGLRG